MDASATYVEGPRHAVITDDDLGPVITIVSLVFMVIMVLAVVLRLMVRFTTSSVPGSDDAIIAVAMVMALGEIIDIALTVQHGLGRKLSLLSSDQLIAVEKGVYASNLFYVLTLALAKTSTLLLLHRLTTSKMHKWAVAILVAVIVAWVLAAVFGVAFQCELPDPWTTRVHSNRCFNIVSFWNAIGAVDIATDLALIVMPVGIVWSLQMSRARKAVVVVGFSFRIVLCAAQLVRLVQLAHYSAGNQPVLSNMGYSIATQFETTFAVIVACVPAFKPFMDRAASGLIGISFKDRGGTYELSSIHKQSARKQSKSTSGNGANLTIGGSGSGAAGSRRKSSARPHDGHADYHAEISAASRSSGKTASRSLIPEEHSRSVQRTVELEVRYNDHANAIDENENENEKYLEEARDFPDSLPILHSPPQKNTKAS